MKYHLLSFALMSAAMALYALGMHPGGSLLFFAGAACELSFWVRVMRRRRQAPPLSSIER